MISVTILTKNSEKYLREVLKSVQTFDEVLIYDNGSTDTTLNIASGFSNVNILKGEFKGFGETHNIASESARNKWILSLDSDEVVSAEMANDIEKLILNTNTVYAFRRNNYYNNKFIKWCGWYPDVQFRLYDKTSTRFTEAKVHESIITKNMNTLHLNSPIIHYSYASLSDFLSKMQSYSTLFAEQNRGKKSSSPCKAVLHGIFAFFKSYFLKQGFLGGYEGFVISTYNANTAFYKYLKLYEANQTLKENHLK
jgi:glycosyltransferase involved in cell wall biosynthesis